MKNYILTTKLGDIEYTSIGKGIPIVFIHGGHSNCFDSLCYRGFDLDKFNLITPSRPGYGNTPLNGNSSPQKTAELIMELVNHLSLNKIIIYGVSAGGLTAITLAAEYPEIVHKLILASAVSKKWLDKTGEIYKTALKIFNPKMEKLTWAVVKLFSKMLPQMIAKSFYPQFSNKPPHRLEKKDVCDLCNVFSHYNSKDGFINDINQNIDYNIFSKIKCPTLIIHSINDNSVLLEHAEYSNLMIKDSELIELDNEWGHLIWIGNDSNESISKIYNFIKNKK